MVKTLSLTAALLLAMLTAAAAGDDAELPRHLRAHR